MSSALDISPKSGLTTFILCLFLGGFGIHRFYVGKIGTGLLMLLTAGGLGLWTVYDVFSIVCKNFTDAHGRIVEIDRSPKAPRNIAIAFACFYFLIFGFLFGVIGTGVSGIRDVGKDELSALRMGNIAEAYTYTSTDFQKEVSPDAFKDFVNHYPQLQKNMDSTFTDVSFNDDSGTIVGSLQMKDGSNVDFEMNFVKENNQWKVLNIDLKKVKPQ